MPLHDSKLSDLSIPGSTKNEHENMLKLHIACFKLPWSRNMAQNIKMEKYPYLCLHLNKTHHIKVTNLYLKPPQLLL